MSDLIDTFFNLAVMRQYLPQVLQGMGVTIVLGITVVATGLGLPRASAQQPVMQVVAGTGTYGPSSGQNVDYANLDVPAVIRTGRRSAVEGMSANGVGTYDIPAFLRKQAD